MGSFLCSLISTFEGKNLWIRDEPSCKLINRRRRIDLVEESERLIKGVILRCFYRYMKRLGLNIDSDAVLGNALKTYDVIASFPFLTDERYNNVLARLIVVVIVLLDRHDIE